MAVGKIEENMYMYKPRDGKGSAGRTLSSWTFCFSAGVVDVFRWNGRISRYNSGADYVSFVESSRY